MKIPLKLTRDDHGFKALEGKAEKRTFDPGIILRESQKAAKRAIGSLSKLVPVFMLPMIDEHKDLVEDGASYASVKWYETQEFSRPTDLVDIQDFLLQAAIVHLRRELRLRSKSARPEDLWDWDTVYSMDNYSSRHGTPQEVKMLVIQALNIIGQLPGDLRAMAIKMADGCTLPEAAKESGIDLYEAMRRQKLVREVAGKILDYGVGDNLFSEIGFKHK